jgi:hypothetical protein
LGTFAGNPAESAAAELNFDLTSFSPSEYSEWEKTGKVPDVKPAAQSSDAETTTESKAGAPSGDESAATSATASQEQPPKGKGADARKAQLSAEIQELLRQRNELKAEVQGKAKPEAKIADPSPAAKPAESELKRPSRPVFGESGHESESWVEFEARQDSYVEAVADYKARQTLKEAREAERKQAEEAKQAEAAATIDKTFRERLGKSQEKHADYAEVAFSAEVPISRPMDAFIRSQEAGPEVLYYLGQHASEAQAIAQMQPMDALFALSKIAISLEPAQAEPPKKEAPVVPITKAAKPATDIRATSAAPVDELKAAVEAGDYARFEELENRRLAERRKRG